MCFVVLPLSSWVLPAFMGLKCIWNHGLRLELELTKFNILTSGGAQIWPAKETWLKLVKMIWRLKTNERNDKQLNGRKGLVKVLKKEKSFQNKTGNNLPNQGVTKSPNKMKQKMMWHVSTLSHLPAPHPQTCTQRKSLSSARSIKEDIPDEWTPRGPRPSALPGSTLVLFFWLLGSDDQWGSCHNSSDCEERKRTSFSILREEFWQVWGDVTKISKLLEKIHKYILVVNLVQKWISSGSKY